VCLLEQRKLDEAEVSAQRAHAIHEAHAGAEESHAFTDLTLLARIAFAAERFDEAASLYQRAIEASDPANPSTVLPVAMNFMSRAHALRALDRFAEAEEPLRGTLEIAEREFPPGSFVIARSLIELAQVIERLGRQDEARALLARARAIVEELPEADRAKYDFSPAQFASLNRERSDGGETSANTLG